MDGSEISVVFQGAVSDTERPALIEAIAGVRQLIPGCTVIVSSWEGLHAPETLGADQVVLSADPGGLPGIKMGSAGSNNVNRQLRSTAAGLAEVRTPFAIKMRSDSSLLHAGMLEFADAKRIVVGNLFTIDPVMFEQMPFHVSDWIQFGSTELLRSYWSAAFMTLADATYYETHPHAPHSTYMDRRFRCRMAVEQHMAIHYAQLLGYRVPQFHNDIRPEVLADHRRFLTEHFVVLNIDQIGFSFPKYSAFFYSLFYDLHCISRLDWLAMHTPLPEHFPHASYTQRRRQKRWVRVIRILVDPFGDIMFFPPIHRFMLRIFRLFWRCLRLFGRI